MMTNNLIDSNSFHTDNQTFMAHEWVEIDVMIKTTRWYKLSCFHHDMGHMLQKSCQEEQPSDVPERNGKTISVD